MQERRLGYNPPLTLFEIALRKLKATVPRNAQEDERRLEVAPLERRPMLFHKHDSRRVMDELKGGRQLADATPPTKSYRDAERHSHSNSPHGEGFLWYPQNCT